MTLDHHKTVMRKVYILTPTKNSTIHHRFVPIDECGTCDVDGSNYLLKAARRMWNEYVRQGFVFTSCEEYEKPLYTSERKQKVKSAMMAKPDSLYREATKAARNCDMELHEARLDPRKFFKKYAEEYPLTKEQCFAINDYDKNEINNYMRQE